MKNVRHRTVRLARDSWNMPGYKITYVTDWRHPVGKLSEIINDCQQ